MMMAFTQPPTASFFRPFSTFFGFDSSLFCCVIQLLLRPQLDYQLPPSRGLLSFNDVSTFVYIHQLHQQYRLATPQISLAFKKPPLKGKPWQQSRLWNLTSFFFTYERLFCESTQFPTSIVILLLLRVTSRLSSKSSKESHWGRRELVRSICRLGSEFGRSECRTTFDGEHWNWLQRDATEHFIDDQ